MSLAEKAKFNQQISNKGRGYMKLIHAFELQIEMNLCVPRSFLALGKQQ